MKKCLVLLCAVSLMTGCSTSESSTTIRGTDGAKESVTVDEVVSTEAEVDDVVDKSDDWWLEQESSNYMDFAYGYKPKGNYTFTKSAYISGIRLNKDWGMEHNEMFDWEVLILPDYAPDVAKRSKNEDRGDTVEGVAKDEDFGFMYYNRRGDIYGHLNELDELRLVVIKLDYVGEKTFMNSPLERVVFGPSLKAIYSDAFKGCVNLKSVILPDQLETLDLDAFVGTGIKDLYVPSSVTKMWTTKDLGFKVTVDKGSYAHKRCIEDGVDFTLSGKEVIGEYGVGDDVFEQLTDWEQEYLRILTEDTDESNTYALLNIMPNGEPSLVELHSKNSSDGLVPWNVKIHRVSITGKSSWEDFNGDLVIYKDGATKSKGVGFDLSTHTLYKTEDSVYSFEGSSKDVYIRDLEKNTAVRYFHAVNRQYPVCRVTNGINDGNNKFDLIYGDKKDITKEEFDSATSYTGTDILTLDYMTAGAMRDYLIANILSK